MKNKWKNIFMNITEILGASISVKSSLCHKQ